MAETEKIAVVPLQTFVELGCVPMLGATVTVTVATEEVAEEQAPLVNTAR